MNQPSIRIAKSLEDAIKDAEIAITSVMARDVDDLHLGTSEQPGIVSYLAPNSVLIITSTLDPKKIERINVIFNFIYIEIKRNYYLKRSSSYLN